MQLIRISLLSLMIALLCGCGAEDWTRTFPGETDYYSVAKNISVDEQGDIIVNGEAALNNPVKRYPFIAKYSPQGKLLWKHEDSSSPATKINVFQRNSMAVDSDGSVYFLATEATTTNPILILRKYNQAGELQLKKTISHSISALGDMKILKDMLLLKTPNAEQVVALNKNGDLRWAYPPSISKTSWPALAATEVDNIIPQPEFYAASPILLLGDNNIAVNQQQQILLLNTEGGLIKALSAASLGAEAIISLAYENQYFQAIGKSGNRFSLYRLDANLQLQNQLELAAPLPEVSTNTTSSQQAILPMDQDIWCVLQVDQQGKRQQLSIFQQMKLLNTHRFEVAEQPIIRGAISASKERCNLALFQIQTSSGDISLKSHSVDLKGNLVNAYSKNNFGFSALASSKNYLFATGFSSNEKGNIATTIKHKAGDIETKTEPQEQE